MTNSHMLLEVLKMAKKEKAEMFEALHPDPTKQGTRVTKEYYDVYKEALLKIIPTKDELDEGIEFMALSKDIVAHLPQEIIEKTSVGWWTTVLKLDLEARGIIKRLPTKGRQRVIKV